VLHYQKKIVNNTIHCVGTTLSVNDVLSIGIFLANSSIKQHQEVNLGICHMQDYGIWTLYNAVKDCNVTTDNLWLDINDLSSFSDGYISSLTVKCSVKVLGISRNKTVGETEDFF